ncbi:MAG: hypothetical protein DHS20C04_14300 [Hyphococcus sp.]|nr:MAG: hypothetical protein DHS20C04_14300 [Marinicaulis sp.]
MREASIGYWRETPRIGENCRKERQEKAPGFWRPVREGGQNKKKRLDGLKTDLPENR